MKNYYEILQIALNAEPEIVDAAYRRLALKYHPDHDPSPYANIRMQEINEAYEVLKDPQKRNKYHEDLVSYGKRGYQDYQDGRIQNRKREEAEQREKEARNQAEAEKRKRHEAEEVVATLIKKDLEARKVRAKYLVPTAAVSLFLFFSFLFVQSGDNVNDFIKDKGTGNEPTETVSSQDSSVFVPPITPTRVIDTITPDPDHWYKTTMTDLLFDYSKYIENVQEITRSQRGMSVLSENELFVAEFLPLIRKIQTTQEEMEKIIPPEKFADYHKETVGIFYHFALSMSLLEEWSVSRSDDSLLDHATSEVIIFNEEIDKFGSLAGFLIEIRPK
jgi:hypothetical protein